MAADQNISKFLFEVVLSAGTVYFSYFLCFLLLLFSTVNVHLHLNQKGGFYDNGRLYQFVTGNGYWICTMTVTAGEESQEKFV